MHDVTTGVASPTELHRRLLFSLLKPVVRLARRFHFPMKSLTELLRLAYFEDLRRSGDFTQVEAAEVLGVSRRTVATLESQFRSDFLAPEHEIEFARRVEDTLSDAPVDVDEVAERVQSTTADVRRVLEALVVSGRATGEGEVGNGRSYRARRGFVSLMQEDVHSRVDALNHMLDVVTAAVTNRLAGDDPRPTVARTLAFDGTQDTMRRLSKDLVHSLRHRCTDAEEEALNEGGAQPYAVTLVLAPLATNRDQ